MEWNEMFRHGHDIIEEARAVYRECLSDGYEDIHARTVASDSVIFDEYDFLSALVAADMVERAHAAVREPLSAYIYDGKE